jgi:hypothetical protein
MSKTFRLFISSTFSDMANERRILHDEVFPKLSQLCASHGAQFQAVDLRWGVNEDSQLDHKTMDICLGEIERCQRLSPRPNFLVLLGDRYGWEPVPARIPSSEFEDLRVEADDAQGDLLDQWYIRDDNAVPPHHALKRRDEDFDEYHEWAPEEEKLRKTLRDLVDKAGIEEEARGRYFQSATHQEIARGGLSLPTVPNNTVDPAEHVLACFRNIEGLPNEQNTFFDARMEELTALKEQLRSRLAETDESTGNVYEYEASWRPADTDDIALTDESAFAARVLAHFSQVITTELDGIEQIAPLEAEQQAQHAFRNDRCRHFAGREQTLGSIDAYLDGDEKRVMAIIGPGGSGKSALMAQATKRVADRPGLLSYRFIGATPASTLIDSVLHSVTEELAQALGNTQDIPTKREELVEHLVTLMGQATAERPITVVLDALDQLTEADARKLKWLPEELPPHAKFIVSALPDLEVPLSRTHHLPLPPLSDEAGSVILDAWLAAAGRTLQPEQRAAVLDGFMENGLPLYLKLAFEQARHWGPTESPAELPTDIDGMVESMLDALEADHTPSKITDTDQVLTAPLVQRALGLLQAARYGLAEHELLDALSQDQEFFETYRKTLHHALPEDRLPVAVWSRMYLDLEPYLVEREAQGAVVLGFFHRQVGAVIGQRYGEGDAARQSHAQLAAYFGGQENYLDPSTRLNANKRRISELVYQSLRAGEWDESVETLSDFDYLVAASIGGLIPILLSDVSDCDSVRKRDDRGQEFGEVADFLAAYSALMSSGFFCELVTHAIEMDTGNHQHISSKANTWLKEMASANTSQDGLWLRALDVEPKNGNIMQRWECSNSFWSAARNGRCLPLDERYCITWNENQLELWDTHYGVNKPVNTRHTHEIKAVWRQDIGQVVSLDCENNLCMWRFDTKRSDDSLKEHVAEVLTFLYKQTFDPSISIPVSSKSTKGSHAHPASPTELTRYAEILREQDVEVDSDLSNLEVFEFQGRLAIAVVDGQNFACDVDTGEVRELEYEEKGKQYPEHELNFSHVFSLPSGRVFFSDGSPALWDWPGATDSKVILIDGDEGIGDPDLILELHDGRLCVFENDQGRLLLIDPKAQSKAAISLITGIKELVACGYPEEDLEICEAYVLESSVLESGEKEANRNDDLRLLLITEEEALIWRCSATDMEATAGGGEAVSWVKTELLAHPPVFDLASLVKLVDKCHSTNLELVSTDQAASRVADGAYLLVASPDNITVYEVDSLTPVAEHVERAIFQTSEMDKYIVSRSRPGPTSVPLIDMSERYRRKNDLPPSPSWPPEGSEYAKYHRPGSTEFEEYLALAGQAVPESCQSASGSSQEGHGIVVVLDSKREVHWRNFRRGPRGEWKPRHLFPDGRLLMNNEHGHLKFLQLMRWDQPISFAEGEGGDQ